MLDLRAARRPAPAGPSSVQLIEPFPRKGNLVLRYRGSGRRKPLLLLAHIDVVEARREDWKTDPFKLVERDGQFIARGTIGTTRPWPPPSSRCRAS
jgi:acetylornithine deacetylase/succinyl-diaminopimelate desuccinylase-like protein